MRKRSLFILPLAALLFSGCLDADRFAVLSYDAKSDAFTFLRIYRNIHGDQAADVQSLLTMYANRDQLFPLEPWSLTSEKGVMRFDDQVRIVDLGNAKLDIAAIKPPVDIRTLENKPGKFFLGPDGLACYYHQVVIPGAVMDKLLESMQSQARETIAKAAADELEARKGGANKASWAHELALLQNPPMGETPFLSALSDESLTLLSDAKTNFTFTRKAGVLLITFHLNAADGGEIQSMLTLLHAAVQNKITTSERAVLVDSADVTLAADGSVTIGVDVNKFAPLLAKVQIAGFGPPAPDKLDDYSRIVEGLKDSKLPLDAPMSAADVVDKFQKGELKGNVAGAK